MEFFERYLSIKDPAGLIVFIIISLVPSFFLAAPETIALVQDFSDWKGSPQRLMLWLATVGIMVTVDYWVIFLTVLPKYLRVRSAYRAAGVYLIASLISVSAGVQLRILRPFFAQNSSADLVFNWGLFQAGVLIAVTSFSVLAFIYKWTTPTLSKLDYSSIHRDLNHFFDLCIQYRNEKCPRQDVHYDESWIEDIQAPLSEARKEAKKIRDTEWSQKELENFICSLDLLCNVFDPARLSSRVARSLELLCHETQKPISLEQKHFQAYKFLKEVMSR